MTLVSDRRRGGLTRTQASSESHSTSARTPFRARRWKMPSISAGGAFGPSRVDRTMPRGERCQQSWCEAGNAPAAAVVMYAGSKPLFLDQRRDIAKRTRPLTSGRSSSPCQRSSFGRSSAVTERVHVRGQRANLVVSERRRAAPARRHRLRKGRVSNAVDWYASRDDFHDRFVAAIRLCEAPRCEIGAMRRSLRPLAVTIGARRRMENRVAACN